MPTVTIGTTDFFVYGDLEEADAYLEGSMGATAWRDESDTDNKKRALVSATRLIDRQTWQGALYEPYQTNAFPRSGLEGVEDGVVPQAIIDATFELAALYVAGEPVQPVSPDAGGVKRLKAGSAEIEYFRGTAFLGLFPPDIMALLGQWLAGAGGVGSGAIATGTDGCSAFKKGYGFTSGI